MNPWKILGVNRAMSEDEVQDEYRKLAWKFHPDRGGDKDKFAVINGAYALLKNPEELRKFILQLKAIGKDCVVCKGAGATFKQRGFSGRAATTCKACEGSGITLKEKRK